MDNILITENRMAKQQKADNIFQSFEGNSERMEAYCGRLRAAFDKVLEADDFFSKQSHTDSYCMHSQKVVEQLEESICKIVPWISMLDSFEQPEPREEAQDWVQKMERRAEIVSYWMEVYKRESEGLTVCER